MLRALMGVVGFLAAVSAASEELYLPLRGDAAGRIATELRIVNPTERSTVVRLELIEAAAGSVTLQRQIALTGGETIGWTDLSELFETERFGALRIKANVTLRVTAVNRVVSSGVTASVPLIDEKDAVAEGAVAIRTLPADSDWRREIGIINPGSAALVTVRHHRKDQVICEELIDIPAGGVRLMRVNHIDSGTEDAYNEWLTFSAPQPVLPFLYEYNDQSGARVFTPVTQADIPPPRRRAIRIPSLPAVTQRVVLTPSRDNTVYQSTDGSLSNGSGIHIFAGSTAGTQRRRALLLFDVASQIPPGSRITGATLTLHVSLTIAGPESMELHRVTADWGEGTSNAGSSRDGDGAASRPGDATWIHRFHPAQLWSAPGGDFAPAADATASVGSGDANWGSSAAMIARVQDWLDRPSANFGWIVVGNETTSTTAKRFDSREVAPSDTRPVLIIDFTR